MRARPLNGTPRGWGARLASALALAGSLPILAARQGYPFDDLLDRLAAAAPELRAAAIEQYLNLFGRLPLIEGGTAIFLAEGDGRQSPRIVGDFTEAGDFGEPVIDGTMTPIDGTDWYYLKLQLDPAARIQYAIALGGTWRPDPRNPRRLVSLGVTMSELRMPAYRRPPEFQPDSTIPKGRVVSAEVESAVLGNTRKVSVYLPSGYSASTARYPVVYFGDGTAYLEDARVSQLLDYAIVNGMVQPLIAVVVDPVSRRQPSLTSSDYRRLIVDELVPFIDRTYRTVDAPAARAVVTASRGAPAALGLVLRHADLFGFCIAFSPALRPTPIDEQIEAGAAQPIRFYVTGSLYDAAWLADARRLRDVLQAKGYDLTYVEIPEGHDILAWRARIRDALAIFFPGGR